MLGAIEQLQSPCLGKNMSFRMTGVIMTFAGSSTVTSANLSFMPAFKRLTTAASLHGACAGQQSRHGFGSGHDPVHWRVPWGAGTAKLASWLTQRLRISGSPASMTAALSTSMFWEGDDDLVSGRKVGVTCKAGLAGAVNIGVLSVELRQPRRSV